MKYSAMLNAAWMMSEKIASIFGVIFVTSFVAKSFGPDIFGKVAITVSFFSIVQTVAIFGTETILFKTMSDCQKKGMRLMTSVKLLRMVLLLILSVPALLYIWLMMGDDFIVFAVAAFFSTLFVTQDIFSVYNNVHLNSRLNTIANVAGLIVSFVISFSIAWYKLNPVWLSLSMIVASLLPYLIKRRYFYQTHALSFTSRRKNHSYLRYLIRSGLPLAISSIFISVQVKMVQFFLTGLGSTHELGLFNAASTVAASWIFIPLAIITSGFSDIFRAKPDMAIKLASRLYGYVVIVSLLMLAVIVLVGHRIINVLYGPAYASSTDLMTLLSLATCFSALGTIAWRYIVKESGFNYLLKKNILLAIVGLLMSYCFVFFWGLKGAAWSVLMTELFSLTIMNYFFKNGIILKIHISSLNYKTYR